MLFYKILANNLYKINNFSVFHSFKIQSKNSLFNNYRKIIQSFIVTFLDILMYLKVLFSYILRRFMKKFHYIYWAKKRYNFC